MQDRLIIYSKYALFWLLFFIDARFFFLFYNYKLSFNLSATEWFLAFVHGMRLDMSTVGYVLLLVGLIFTITSFLKGKWLYYIITPITFLLLAVFTTIVIADMELYRIWGFRMDTTPLLYLKTPKEALASITTGLLLFLLTIIVAYMAACIFVYRNFVAKDMKKLKPANWMAPASFLFISAFMILPIRGSLGIAPLNTGMVYFSKKSFANHAAVNVVWNVAYSLTKFKSTNALYHFFEDEKAESIVDSLYASGTTASKRLIKTDTPNIIIIILESFSSNIIGSLGGMKGITPNFNKLSKEGVLFINFFASGDRSDKGIVSILSGYPAQPQSSIIKFPQKTRLLPYLAKDLKKTGYHTSFYYGGNINFANMRSYLLNSEFDEIISEKDFKRSECNSKWGAHDDIVFGKLFGDVERSNSPFLKIYFTLSSHEPFEIPMQPEFGDDTEEHKFLSAAFYTDKCLGRFIEKLKQSNAWDSTLVVFVADHGSRLPGNIPYNSLIKYKIPMLWVGGSLGGRDSVISVVGSQTDIPATLLSQLGQPATQYIFGNNMLSANPASFAFFAFNNGFGFVSDSFKTVYDNVNNEYIFKEGQYTESDLDKGKAFLQVLGNDFVNK